jgi:hypothetical protein
MTITEDVREQVRRRADEQHASTPQADKLAQMEQAANDPLFMADLREAMMERKHAEGYARHPVEPGEFDGWEKEQAWGEP